MSTPGFVSAVFAVDTYQKQVLIKGIEEIVSPRTFVLRVPLSDILQTIDSRQFSRIFKKQYHSAF